MYLNRCDFSGGCSRHCLSSSRLSNTIPLATARATVCESRATPDSACCRWADAPRAHGSLLHLQVQTLGSGPTRSWAAASSMRTRLTSAVTSNSNLACPVLSSLVTQNLNDAVAEVNCVGSAVTCAHHQPQAAGAQWLMREWFTSAVPKKCRNEDIGL